MAPTVIVVHNGGYVSLDAVVEFHGVLPVPVVRQHTGVAETTVLKVVRQGAVGVHSPLVHAVCGGGGVVKW